MWFDRARHGFGRQILRSLSELKASRRLHGFRGVTFPRLEQTFARLDAIRKEQLRQRRRELAKQRRAIDKVIQDMLGDTPY